MFLTADQARAARALLGWSQQRLAQEAKVAKQTIADFERGARLPYERTLRDIQLTLEVAGIEFLQQDGQYGVGVRFKQPQQ